MATVVGYEQAAKKRATCGGCSAIIEYVLNEVTEEVHRDYGGGSDVYHFVTCPGCSKKVYVKGY